jgi:hypothetical protein
MVKENLTSYCLVDVPVNAKGKARGFDFPNGHVGSWQMYMQC